MHAPQSQGVAPRRILMTADALGGVWTYALELARHLGGMGVEVVLATMGGPLERRHHEEAERAGVAELVEGRFALEWMDEPWADVARAGSWLLELEARFAPDLVHLNGYSHAALPWAAPVVVIAHSCVLSWWRAVYRGPAPSRYGRYRAAVAAGLGAAAAVVAPTRTMLRFLMTEYGPLRRAVVIPNGISHERFRPGPKEPFLLAAGRLWDRGKNVDLLVRAAASIRWPVHVAGEACGPAAPAEVPAGVTWLGRLEPARLAEVMARAAVFVHPALYEPFGLAPLEAAACGCALLLGDIPSLREVWGEAARYADPRDPEALIDAAQGLINHGDELAGLARRARRRAARYAGGAMAAAYRGLYADVLEGAARRRDLAGRRGAGG